VTLQSLRERENLPQQFEAHMLALGALSAVQMQTAALAYDGAIATLLVDERDRSVLAVNSRGNGVLLGLEPARRETTAAVAVRDLVPPSWRLARCAAYTIVGVGRVSEKPTGLFSKRKPLEKTSVRVLVVVLLLLLWFVLIVVAQVIMSNFDLCVYADMHQAAIRGLRSMYGDVMLTHCVSITAEPTSAVCVRTHSCIAGCTVSDDPACIQRTHVH
jgi:hypothetical protein